MVVKIYDRIVINHVERINESLLGEEQDELGRRRGCADQIFSHK